MASVIDHYGDNQDVIIANAGPGHWNDPDMVRMFNLRPSFNLIRLIQFFQCTWYDFCFDIYLLRGFEICVSVHFDHFY